jgi:hypothetical protein
MIVDGTREMVGSNRDQVLAAVRDARPETIAPVTFAADHRSVAIGAGNGRGNVLLVRFAQKRTTRVAGGENARRTLQDANGVEMLTASAAGTGRRSASPSNRPLTAKGSPYWSRRPMAECSARLRFSDQARCVFFAMRSNNDMPGRRRR